MWCPDDVGRDSWDWVGPPAWERACFNSPEWGGGSSPVKTECRHALNSRQPGGAQKPRQRSQPPCPSPPRHRHCHKLRHHGPQQHSLHCVFLSLLPDSVSSDSGEELNLRNLHCLQRQPQKSLCMLRCSHSWNTSFPFFIFFCVSSFSFSSPRSVKHRSSKNTDWTSIKKQMIIVPRLTPVVPSQCRSAR